MIPHTIHVRNVNDALVEGSHWLRVAGIRAESRNGVVLRAPGPVFTVYRIPTERVLFDPERDANPFFHFMEGLWMLAARNDVAFLQQFNSRISQFSDDGTTIHGAYGKRWRDHFSIDGLCDQLPDLILLLKDKPDTRRAVLQMWDASSDLSKVYSGKDVPCNTQAYFYMRDGCLCMTVCCRSNDMVWGAYGANAVHFSMLLEYMAAGVGVPVGELCQFSNDFHFYLERDGVGQTLPVGCAEQHRYHSRHVQPFPLVSSFRAWDEDLETFIRHPTKDPRVYDNNLFKFVAAPMYEAWQLRKAKAPLSDQLAAVNSIVATDWQLACREWIMRREEKKHVND